MRCASCARMIKTAVSRLIGIKSAEVNFGTETLSAEYDETKIGPEEMQKAVKEVGYKLDIPLPAEDPPLAEAKAGEKKISMGMEGHDHFAMEKQEKEKEVSDLKKKV